MNACVYVYCTFCVLSSTCRLSSGDVLIVFLFMSIIITIIASSLLMQCTCEQPLPSCPLSTQSSSTLVHGYSTALGVVSVLLVISLVGNATALLVCAVLRLSRKETVAVK